MCIKMYEPMQMKGIFIMRVLKKGKLIETYEDHNLIVNGARRSAASLIAGKGKEKHISQIAFGTNGNIPTPDDTEITSPFVKPITSVTFPSDGVAEFHWNLFGSEANGKAIIEFGLLCEDLTLWSRKIREKAIPKEADIALEGEWQILF